MTIECTACHARYTIADTIVPPQGARVRCRKCGAVFAVKPPEPVVAPPPLPVVPPTPQPEVVPPTPAPRDVAPPTPEPREVVSAPSAPEPPAHAPEPSAPPHPTEAFAPHAVEAPAPHAVEFERFPAQGADPAAHVTSHEFERFPSSPGVSTVEPTAAPSVQPRVAAADPMPPAPPASAPPTHLAARPELPPDLAPEERQKHERARRLARVLASDIAIYNKEKRDRGIREGNLVAVLGYEIKKSWETYKERVGADFANSTPYFRDALNDIVAEGQKVF